MKLHSMFRLLCVHLLAFATVATAQVVAPIPSTSPTTASTKPTSAAGEYLGKLDVGAVTLRLGLSLTHDGDKWSGVLDSIDQNSKLAIDTVTIDKDEKLTFAIAQIAGSFSGTVAKDFSSIDGTWTQLGRSMPLKFERVDKAVTLNRPQEPKPPFPYDAETETIDNKPAGVTLAGTLTKPKTGGPFPVVVLITGSGPQDRDEGLMGHKPFAVLADHLTRKGIAVLRFDDRGVGKSTGSFLTATDDDFASDVTAAVQFLKTRKDVDSKRIGLVGHSEGGVVGPMVASTHPDDIAFLVMLAGVGVPMDELMVRQTEDASRVAGASKERIEEHGKTNRKIFDLIKSVDDPAELKKQLKAFMEKALADLPEAERKDLPADALDGQLQMVVSPWFRQLIKYDPAPVLAKVKCPVLAVNGAKDVQVSSKENLAGIKAGLNAGGNQKVEIVEYPGLNHLFQHCQTGAVSEYGTIEETMSPEVLEKIATWINAQQ